MLRCEHLSFAYGGTGANALDDVSLMVRPGALVGMAGRSGSGKTTLLRCLAGLLSPTSDNVEADGERPPGLAYRQLVGYVPQRPEEALFAKSVYEDVAFGPRNLGLSETEADERVTWALGAVGLEAARFGERSPFALSGGEARRVALAGTLALRPRYLLLDEPTAGLDPHGSDALLALLFQLACAGMGVVIASHELDALTRWCGEAVLLSGGRVQAAGPVAATLGNPQALASCGLMPSATVDLAERLRARGLAVPAGVTTVSALASAVLGKGGGRR